MILTQCIKLSVFISFTQLRYKINQTLIAILSVMCGVAIFIYVAGYINGVNRFTSEMTIKESPDIRLFNEISSNKKSVIDYEFSNDINIVYHAKPSDKSLGLKDGKFVIEELKNNPNIKYVSSSVKTQVYFNVGGINISGVLTGINFEEEDKIFNLKSKLTAGNFRQMETMPNAFVMGEKLARRLNLDIKDKVNLITDNGQFILGTLVGIIKTGIPEKDKELCYTSEKTVQLLLDAPSAYITEIKIKIRDITCAPELAHFLGDKYKFNHSNWQIDNAAIFEGAEIQALIFNCIAICLLIVAGFGIYNILNMSIYEKMKDIAILKAMGFSSKDILYIFLSQSLIIGLLGGISGIILGFLLAFCTSLIPYKSDVFVSVDHLPMNFSNYYYLVGIIFAIITTFFAGYFPARKAAKSDPLLILKK